MKTQEELNEMPENELVNYAIEMQEKADKLQQEVSTWQDMYSKLSFKFENMKNSIQSILNLL